jgi:PAS domain S-box-containing protein
MKIRPLRRILSYESALVAAFPFLLVAVLGAVWLFPKMKADIETRQRQLAGAIGSQVQAYLAASRADIMAVTALVNDRHLSSHDLENLLEVQINVSTALESLYVVGPDGRIVATGLRSENALHRLDMKGLDLSRNQLIRDVASHHRPIWSDTFLSMIGGGLSVALAVPAGNMVVVGEVELARLQKFLNRIATARDQLIVVLDRHGQVIADQEGRYTAQQLNLSNIPLVREGLRTSVPYSGEFEFEGRSMLGTMIDIPSIQWNVLVALPKSAAYHILTMTTRITVIGMVAAVLLSLAASLLMARRLASRFEGLANHARQVANGANTREWPNGNILEFEQLARDLQQMAYAIQERERLLSKNQRLLQSVMDNTFQMQGLLAPDGRVVDINRTALELVGVDKESVIGRLFWDTPWWNHDPTLQASLRDAVTRASAGEFVRFEAVHLDAEGQRHFFDSSLKPLKDENGKIIYLIPEGRDITESKLFEQKLAREKYFGDTVIESLPLIFYVHDGKKFVRWNKALEETSGLTGEELMNTAPLDFIHNEDREYIAKKMAEVFAHGYAEAETRVVTVAGLRQHYMTGRKMVLDDTEYLVGASMDITDRKNAETKLLRHMENLAALRVIDLAITSSLDLATTLNVLLEQTVKQLQVDAACVLLFNPQSQMLEYAAGLGFGTDRISFAKVRYGDGFAGKIAHDRKICILSKIDQDSEDVPQTLVTLEKFKAYIGIPLIAKNQVKGVLEVFHRTTFTPVREWLEFAEALSGQAAIAIDNAEMFDNLQRSHAELLISYDTTIEGWAHALDVRDRETEGHSRRVTEISEQLARACNVPDEELVHIRRGALLHDIGKLGVSDSILLKPAALTNEERDIIQDHPNIAFRLLSPIPFLKHAIDIPYCHHERWDGTGYPRELKGEEIPLAARIFAIVDVWDALSSDRPYRLAWTREKILDYIRSRSGTDFDPVIVEKFLAMIEGS